MKTTLYLCGLPPKAHDANLIMRKASNSDRRAFYNITDYCPSKLSRPSKTMKKSNKLSQPRGG